MGMRNHENPVAARALEAALVWTFVAHAAAMVGMAVLLLPGVPGGADNTIDQRAAYVASHPWLWRLGWFGWQATAASDLFLSIALLCTRWVPKRPAVFALTVTLMALLPDQIGQFSWSVYGPDWAARALAQNDFATYAALEQRHFQAVGGWGAALYLVAAIGWTFALRNAGVWSTWLARLSIATWSIFAVAVTIVCLPPTTWTPLTLGVGGALNAAAFVLLLAWIAVAGELVMRRARPETSHGRHARWQYPTAGFYGSIVNVLANSRFVRGLFEYVPAFAMASDIRDVIYVNYLADADALAKHVPAPLQLQRLGNKGQYAMLTFLVYRHGHFGPQWFGPLRKLWRSPMQSNWRLYVWDPASGLNGVYFLTTTITAVPYALAARYLSEGVPMHIPFRAAIRAEGGHWSAVLDPGIGTAPDLQLSLKPIGEPFELPAAWREIFATPTEALAYCVPQDRTLGVQPWLGRRTRQEIRLNIPLESCVPLRGQVTSAYAATFVGDATPFCFYVPRVSFFYDGEWASVVDETGQG